MKSLGIALIFVGLVLAVAPSISAQSNTFSISSKDNGGGNFVWTDASGATTNPPFTASAAGASITLTATNADGGFHGLEVKDGSTQLKKGDDIGAKGDTSTITFTLPSSGSVTYDCPYHSTTMHGTISVAGATTTTKKSPGTQLVGVSIAMIGAALLLRRK